MTLLPKLMVTGLLASCAALLLIFISTSGASNNGLSAKKPPAVMTSWKSGVSACSVKHRGKEYTFQFLLSGRANNWIADINRLKYKITPSAPRSKKNNLLIGPALYSGRQALNEGRLSAGRGWQNKRVKLQMRRGELHRFEAIFDLPLAADPRCEGTIIL